MAKKKAGVRLVRVSYRLLNRPNHKGINKAVSKLGDQGYKLQNRQDVEVGCLTLLFTFGWARGRSELTFVLAE